MDASIVPNPDLTIQSCWAERRHALSGYPAPAANIAAAAHTIAQNNTM